MGGGGQELDKNVGNEQIVVIRNQRGKFPGGRYLCLIYFAVYLSECSNAKMIFNVLNRMLLH